MIVLNWVPSRELRIRARRPDRSYVAVQPTLPCWSAKMLPAASCANVRAGLSSASSRLLVGDTAWFRRVVPDPGTPVSNAVRLPLSS